jgi:beta-lactamase regulating signal transducer with metallopeptidase domain
VLHWKKFWETAAMNDLGITIIWLAGQVTVLCLLVLLCNVALRRRHRPASSVTFTGLLLVCLLTVISLSPWPRWSWNSEAAAAGSQMAGRSQAATSASAETTVVKEAAVDRVDPGLLSATAAAWTAFTQTIGREVAQPDLTGDQGGLRWTGCVAVLCLLAVSIGLLRLGLGWVAICGCIRRSQPLDGMSINEILEVLCAEHGCTRRVQLRVSHEIIGAATTGWRRPLILLPSGWSEWSAAEQRMVLSHELAHIMSGDSLTWLVAQTGLALHFYHPLVHLLVRQFRVDQELLADASAAGSNGGAQRYLNTLAGLAVRQPQRPVAWPARAFLPERGTLLRRIEMLRDARLTHPPALTWRRRLLVCATIATGLVISGIRPPEAQVAAATTRTSPSEAAAATEFDMTNVPASAVLVVAARPAELAGRPEFATLAVFINSAISEDKIGFSVSEIAQFLMIGLKDPNLPRGQMFPPVLEIRLNQAHDFAALAEHLWGGATLQTVDGMTVLAAADVSAAPNQEVLQIIGDRTVVYGRLPALKIMAASTGQPAWSETWNPGADSQIAFAIDMAFPRKEMEASFRRTPNPMMGMFAPLWQKTELVTGDVAISDQMTITLRGSADSDESAGVVQQTVNALIPVGQGLLMGGRSSLENTPDEYRSVMTQAFDVGEAALKSAKVVRDGKTVTVTVSADEVGVATITTMLLPAVQSAREAARRTQGMNNLKQIMLALHNYHDANGSFPPAVLLGPDGKTEYSWRVALLPYLDQSDLYNAYRRTEPWDSPHNKALLSDMPLVFKCPQDSPNSSATSYFGFIGKDTGFGNTPGTGNKLHTFTDGLSNTVMVVETRRDIPWTKPEDIPFSGTSESPELGGWFNGGYNVGLADGSVRFFAAFD